MEIPRKLQDQIVQYQQMEKQLENLQLQRAQIAAQMAEVQSALEALERASPDAVVYETRGSIMVRRSGREEVMAELKERKDLLEVRLKSVEKNFAELQARFADLQRKLASKLGGVQAG